MRPSGSSYSSRGHGPGVEKHDLHVDDIRERKDKRAELRRRRVAMRDRLEEIEKRGPFHGDADQELLGSKRWSRRVLIEVERKGLTYPPIAFALPPARQHHSTLTAAAPGRFRLSMCVFDQQGGTCSQDQCVLSTFSPLRSIVVAFVSATYNWAP